MEDFKKICDRFTNKKIFECDQGGNLSFDDKGNLIKKINFQMKIGIINYGLGNLSVDWNDQLDSLILPNC